MVHDADDDDSDFDPAGEDGSEDDDFLDAACRCAHLSVLHPSLALASLRRTHLHFPEYEKRPATHKSGRYIIIIIVVMPTLLTGQLVVSVDDCEAYVACPCVCLPDHVCLGCFCAVRALF